MRSWLRSISSQLRGSARDEWATQAEAWLADASSPELQAWASATRSFPGRMTTIRLPQPSPEVVDDHWATAGDVLRWARGYVAYLDGHEGPVKPGATLSPTWRTLRAHGWVIHHDPRLPITATPQGAIILGHAACSPDAATARECAKKLSSLVSLVDENGPSEQWEPFDNAIARWGGRYIVFLRIGDRTRIYGDPMASMTTMWATTGSVAAAGDELPPVHPEGRLIALASHATLIAHATATYSMARSQRVFSHPDYVNPHGTWLPGAITAADAALPLVANCALTVDHISGAVSHRRFFPRSTSLDHSTTDALTAMLGEIRWQTRTWIDSHRGSSPQLLPSESHPTPTPRTYLALTGGGDSGYLLHTCHDLLRSAGATMLTYAANLPTEDVTLAQERAERWGFEHRTVELRPWDPSPASRDNYHRTFKGWARFPAMAQLMREQFSPADLVIWGVGGEIGTMFYEDRSARPVSAQTLAQKFTSSPFRHDPWLHQVFEHYRKFTELPAEPLGDYDPYDLFYWECRLSNWAALWYSEMEGGPMVALPMNSRTFFTAMLSFSDADRMDKAAYAVTSAAADLLRGQ